MKLKCSRCHDGEGPNHDNQCNACGGQGFFASESLEWKSYGMRMPDGSESTFLSSECPDRSLAFRTVDGEEQSVETPAGTLEPGHILRWIRFTD